MGSTQDHSSPAPHRLAHRILSSLPAALLIALALAAETTPASAGGPHGWVAVRNGQVPRGAVVGGDEGGKTLYVCRARYRNGTYLGKLFAGKCNIGANGREIAMTQYEVMTVPDQRQVGWATVPLGRLPDDAVVAGTLGGGPVYTCRMRYGRGIHPGRLDTGKCTIGWGGREVSSPQFEILYVRRTVAAAPPPRRNTPPPRPPTAYTPPPRQDPPQTQSSNEPVRWYATRNGRQPGGAVVGGVERGRNLYVCRASYGGGIHPGKHFGQHCNIGWGGKEVALASYDILVVLRGGQTRWVRARNGEVPRDAWVGGIERGRNLYVCRASYGGGVHPGKLFGRHCNIGWGGREISLADYEVLTVSRQVAARPPRTSRPAPPNPPPAYNPPPRHADPAPPSAAGPYEWVAVRNGRVPRNAVSGGSAGGPLFHICRASYQGGVHPGKLYKGTCYIGWGGKEVPFRDYEAMTHRNGLHHRWVGARNGAVPSGAVAGGSQGSTPLYVCRAKYGKDMHPGKLYGRNCNIGLAGRELTYPTYQVMVSAGATATHPRTGRRPPPRTERRPPPPVTGVRQPRRPAGPPPGGPQPGGAERIYWVSASASRVPGNAVSGGSVGGPLFHICRASYQGGVHPGKLYKGTCYIGWGGKEVPFRQYEVMAQRGRENYRWVGARNGAVPRNAIAGGGQGSTPLYVCRAKHANHMHPGKLYGRNCNIGLSGKELTYPTYQVMVSTGSVSTPPPVAHGGTPQPPPGRPTVQSPPGRPTVASAPPPTTVPYRPGAPPSAPPPQAGTTRSFALANRTLRSVELFRGGHDSSRHYVGTVPSGRVYSSESRVGEMFYFSQDNRWVGAYRIDQRARRQLIELPTLQVYEVD